MFPKFTVFLNYKDGRSTLWNDYKTVGAAKRAANRMVKKFEYFIEDAYVQEFSQRQYAEVYRVAP